MRYLLVSVESGAKKQIEIPEEIIKKVKKQNPKKQNLKTIKTSKKIQSSKPMMHYKRNKKRKSN